VNVMVNNENISVDDDVNVMRLIDVLGLPSKGAVCAVNSVVVAKSEWSTTYLNPGDDISLFQVIAGG
jgi:sulfur carrier protein